jgi:hypothetical protein
MSIVKKLGVGCAIIVLTGIAFLVGLYEYTHPSWKEVYSFQNDQIIVTRSDPGKGRLELENVLVVQVTGKTDWSGGWGCSGKAPEAGAECHPSPHEIFAITSFYSDTNGKVPFQTFVAKGYGKTGAITGHTKGGFVKILLYKRDFRLGEVLGRMNQVQESPIRMFELSSSSPLKSGSEEVLKLLCPFSFADATMQKAYWSHKLPSGTTIQDYALGELEVILQKDIDQEEKLLIQNAIERIKAEKFDGYPTNTYQLTKP